MSKATIAKLERALHYTKLALEAAKAEPSSQADNIKRLERIEIAKRMKKNGLTLEVISESLNVSVFTVQGYLK